MKTFFRVSLLFFLPVILIGCAPGENSKTIPKTSTVIREIPTSFFVVDQSSQFLFITVLGNDLCSDKCGECVVTEAVAPSFEFKDEKLILYDFGDLYDKSFQGVKTWNEYKSKNNLIGLRYFQKEWSFASPWEDGNSFIPITQVPFSVLADIFVIHQIDRLGNVHILLEDKLIELKPLESLTISVSRQDEGFSCVVEHKYTMTNYGFILDRDVILMKP